ncbi:sugar ABC transporter ATP-binding protein [Ramlibacter sp. AW1]|uniref:Sugar ABC transporter ATP-binding protein n=1 Tax=Ramlibacter aurantiacus TaxID=2801330 RepID=A0A936ZQX7_9BURK|nr:sugar ABC transporter ATP-binding protein [Ramlibacter aurantiacus]MBL0421848.1 sugar ABC transporter ATP-binding protein [Ramlibacter aurantiacus]
MTELEVCGLSKHFGATQALADVSLSVRGGQVLALIGENGAGKSTLIKVLSGIHRPDRGEVRLNGQPLRLHSPAEGMAAGIVLVPQDLHVVPGLSVAENILLGHLPTRRVAGVLPSIDRKAMRAMAQSVLQDIGVALHPDTPAGELSFAERQLVVIARALGREARVLILDEPTASLERREVERLFDVVRRLRAQSVAVIYISHRLEEVEGLADRCVVLRDGRVVAHMEAPPFPIGQLVEAMTGRVLADPGASPRESGQIPAGAPRLRVALEGGTFECRSGEIAGIGGLLGSGAKALLRRLFGASDAGGASPHGSIRHAIAAGVGLVPGERAHSLVMSMSVRDNIVLAHLDAYAHAFARHEGRIDEAVARLMELLDIRPRSPHLPVAHLSGGNQQKVAFAKWLVARREVLLLDEPTNGIDIAAKALIHERIIAFAAEGGSVVLSSSDLPELLALSDTISVLRQGRLAGRMEPGASFGEARLRDLLESSA